jgi:signal transduction histidine kinase
MKLGLSAKTTITIICLILVAVVGSSIALVYAWQEKHVMDEMVSENVGDVISVEELDVALLKQKGFVAAYIVDKGNRKWIDELERLEPEFDKTLDLLEQSAGTDEDRALFRRAHRTFDRYAEKRRDVVSLYDAGKTEAAVTSYLGDLNEAYLEAIAACDTIVEVNKRHIKRALGDEQQEISRLTAVMAGSGVVVALLGLGLSWLLFSQVFVPLKRMARDMRVFSSGGELSSDDDFASLQYHTRALLEEISRSRSKRSTGAENGDQLDRLAAVGNAVAFIAHEIRNRLMMIGGFARTIERHPDDPDRVQQEAGIIFQSSSRLEQMLAEVMEYSKPPRAPRSEQSLNDLVRGTVSSLADYAPPGVTIEVALDPSAPAVVMDSGAMEQVIINLVRNAVEAFEKGGTVKVSTSCAAGEAILVVEDDGPGIPAEIRGKVFEPFFTTKKSGSGLGLSICSKIVSEHGGEISISSEPGRGTAFRIVFKAGGAK